MKALTN